MTRISLCTAVGMQTWRIAVVLFLVCGAHGAGTSDYIHYRLGVKYKNENKLDQATEEFRRVLAAYPDNYNAYMHLAEIRMKQNKPRLVVYNLKRALAYNPGWGKAHRMLAKAYQRDGQTEKAIMELQLYQQSCDPAERDSIQQWIDALVEGREPPSSGEKTTQSKGSNSSDPDKAVQSSGASAASRSGTSRGLTKRTASVRSASPQIEELFQKGVALYNERKYGESVAVMRKVLARQPGHPGAYYYAGLVRRRQGKNNMAKINFEKSLAYPDLGYNAHFYLGKIYGEQGSYDTAIEHLRAYIQKTDYEAGQEQARELIAQYRGGQSKAAREAEAKKKPLPLDMEVERKIKKETLSSIELRIDSLLTMVIVDSLSDPGQKMLRGVKEFKAANFDKAVQEFKQVLVEYPTGSPAAECIYNIGVCYYKMRLFKEAENQFQQVIDRYASHMLAPRSTFLKALTYLERKESRRAEKILRGFIQHNRKHEWVGKAYEKLGDAYVDLEKPKRAVDAYRQAAAQAGNAGDRVFALYKLGTTYLELDNASRAMDAFRDVIENGEKSGLVVRVPDAHYKVADHLYQEKEYTKALEYYRRATRKYPRFQETPWGLFQIANIYKNTEKHGKAIETYKKLMKTYPEDYWAKQARWKMEDAIWEYEYRSVLK